MPIAGQGKSPVIMFFNHNLPMLLQEVSEYALKYDLGADFQDMTVVYVASSAEFAATIYLITESCGEIK